MYFNGDFHLYLYSSDFTDEFENFSIAKAIFGFATPITNTFTFNFSTSGGFKIGKNDVNSLDFALGGYGNNLINNYTPFLGYDFLEISGNSFVKAMATIDYEFAPKHHFNFTTNVANVDDDIFETTEWITAPNFTGYSFGYGLETFIGPVEVKYSWSPERGKGQWFFNVGFWF